MIEYTELLNSRDQITERIVLSKIITTGFISPEIDEAFFLGNERLLFAEFKKQWEKKTAIDTQILSSECREVARACLEMRGSASSHAIERLRDFAIRRSLAREIIEFGIDDEVGISESLGKLQDGISKAIFKAKPDYDHKKEISILLNELEKAQTKKNSIAGFSSGLVYLDDTINGFERGKVYAIGALKKTGKSRFGVFISCSMRASGAGVLWNSLEMSSFQLNALATSFYSGINSNNLGRMMKPEVYTQFNEGLSGLEYLNWAIYKEHSVTGLKSRIIAEKQKKNIDVVIIDFVQRMRSTAKHGTRADELDRIAQDLADMSRDLNVAVIEFSQLSGQAEKLEDGEIPDVQHYKESQGIPENADVNLILHNSTRNQEPYNGKNEYQIQKFKIRVQQRYDISNVILDANADLRNCRFEDVKK